MVNVCSVKLRGLKRSTVHSVDQAHNVISAKDGRGKWFKVCLRIPEIGEDIGFEQQVSDISHADITNDLSLGPLYYWKTTYLVISHLLESFQY